MTLRLLIPALGVFLSLAIPASAQPGMLYRGRLQPEPVPSMTTIASLAFVEAGKYPSLPATVPPAVSVYTGNIDWANAGRNGKVSVAVVQTRSADRFGCADLDANGRYGEAECGRFVPGEQEDGADPEVRFWVPTRVGPYRRLPLVLMLPARPIEDGHLTLHYSGAVYARGDVSIDGRQTLLTLGVSLSKGGLIDPRNTSIGLDGNGNGKIDPVAGVLEFTWAENEDVVFRVADRCVRVREVDPTSGAVVLEERPSSEYLTIDQVVGAVLPDFAFTELDGRSRRLSDFTGKYVLLDFWGTWCSPCIAQVPYLKTAYDKLHERGLEIVGIDYEFDGDTPAGLAASLEKVRKVANLHGMMWLQATPASSRELVTRRFRVQGFPTHLLIGPDRKLLIAGKDRRLRDANLLPTLETIIRQP